MRVVDLDKMKAAADAGDAVNGRVVVSSDYLRQIHKELTAHRKQVMFKGSAFGLSPERQL